MHLRVNAGGASTPSEGSSAQGSPTGTAGSPQAAARVQDEAVIAMGLAGAAGEAQAQEQESAPWFSQQQHQRHDIPTVFLRTKSVGGPDKLETDQGSTLAPLLRTHSAMGLDEEKQARGASQAPQPAAEMQQYISMASSVRAMGGRGCSEGMPG